MKATRTDIGINFENRKAYVKLEFDTVTVEQLAEMTSPEQLEVTIKKWSDDKTKSQNAYVWALLTEIGKKYKVHRTEAYKKLLRDNKNFDDILLPSGSEARINILKSLYRVVDVFGVVNITTPSGKTVEGTQIRLYRGMSDFDKDEMAEFIELVVSECEQLNIPTSPELYKGVCDV